VPGGAIARAAQPAPQPQPAPAPQPQPAPAPRPSATAPPTAPRAPSDAPGGTYGPVQRSETLWGIAERFRPAGVTMNQMMVAVFQANPAAFAGNMNLLQAGATLRIPDPAALGDLTVAAANAEALRQNDEWQQGRGGQQARLRLVPPEEAPVAAPATSPRPEQQVAPAPVPAAAPPAATPPAPEAVASAAPEPSSERLLQIEDPALANLQTPAGAEAPAEPPVAEPPASDVGVDLESEQLFTDEVEAPAPTPAAEAPAAEPAPVRPAAAPVAAADEPSLVSRALDWVMSPILWIGLGVAALLLSALWFVRRRRQEPADVTGRWEALESEVDDEDTRESTERMRRQAPEESFVVQESARPRRAEPIDAAPAAAAAAAGAAALAARAHRAPAPADETLSSQTVINLDSADALAEADFHMAYGLYDQAAELVSKALEAQPGRRDLKLKLLEVFFVWGNKDAFLKEARSLHEEIGDGPDADWDKVVIMGKQICPDERLFAEAATAGGRVDVDLEAGESPALDLAFDETDASGAELDLGKAVDAGLDFDFDAPSAPSTPRAAVRRDFEVDDGDSLDIGERTAAGLEAALFMEDDEAKDDAAAMTTPDVAADSLAVTQESPTIESPSSHGDWARVSPESPTAEFLGMDAPTVETPTIETVRHDAPTVETPTLETARHDAPTMETPTIETAYRSDEPPTVEQPKIPQTDRTAEIDLDDLGLDIKDLEDLPVDLGDLPAAASSETDTREQPALRLDDELLSATGVTQVLSGDDDEDLDRNTSVLDESDATLLATGLDDGTLTGTEVLEHRFEDDESGNTSLVKSLRGEDDALDFNLDDFSTALQGADTVEQPRSSSFSRDVFGGGGRTPVDLDIGTDDVLAADDPTGTEEMSPLDPQTMTEVGTKLDLARAYIDMGDPEGARSILEEVLDEGDPGQRREAQSLIDVLSA
jgi:pilus assembly protein FimV